MKNESIKKLAMSLLNADSEAQVEEILREAGYWDNSAAWRLYGDKEGNFAQAGNQQALPEAALVEKIVNSADSRLMSECLLRGISPESSEAPVSVRDAVAMFFEDRRSLDGQAGMLSDWPAEKRTSESRNITIAATGDRPTRGHSSKKFCLTIADQSEGQTGSRLPRTILSLNAKNKQRIRFVQGKFNMGGTGALRFCGNRGFQLVISRRNPQLVRLEGSTDPSANDWAVTIVRREEPSDKSGAPIHSEFTYLAPVGIETAPRGGEVLTFSADALPLMPEQDKAYARKISYGTAIKLYEYETSVGQSNVLMKDGLMFALERLLPEIALPIRIHECRGYEGKKGSFETPIAGLVVRLEEGKGDNLEPGFPLSVHLRAADMQMTARIYAFKESRGATYLKDEGVIFALNGQAHGYLPKSIFSRPKAVGLPRLKDSLLVLIDCSGLKVTQREDLFMSSRDRLSKKPIRYLVEEEIEELLKNNTELRKLQQERREKDVETTLSEEKPLEEVLGKIFESSPTLKTLFLQGRRLARPFATGAGGVAGENQGSTKSNSQKFVGVKHPTYFRVPDMSQNEVFRRNCEEGRRVHVKFETDVENSYFDRSIDKGTFALEIVESSCPMRPPSYSIPLEDGWARLNMALPPEAKPGEYMVLQATVTDPTLVEPLACLFRLSVGEKQVHPTSTPKPRPPSGGSGVGQQSSQAGISLPRIVLVRENDANWVRQKFTNLSSCKVVTDPIEVAGQVKDDHTFYVNLDNVSLRTEMKYTKQDPRLLEAKFKYANVLLGLAILHESEKRGGLRMQEQTESDDNERDAISPQAIVAAVTQAAAPVLIPLIDQLSGLTAEQLDEMSVAGEDA